MNLKSLLAITALTFSGATFAMEGVDPVTLGDNIQQMEGEDPGQMAEHMRMWAQEQRRLADEAATEHGKP